MFCVEEDCLTPILSDARPYRQVPKHMWFKSRVHLPTAFCERRQMSGSSSTPSEPMSPKMAFFFSRIFPIVFITIGAGIALVGIRGLLRAKASMDWPSAPGRVLEASVVSHRSRRNAGSRTIYHAEILYAFTVDGTPFSGNRVAYGDYGSSNPSHARQVVTRYPKGTIVTVYYMPGNPNECLLEPGIRGQSFLLPGFGFIFFAVGSLIAIFLPKAINKQRTSEPDDGQLSSEHAPLEKRPS